MVMSKDIKNEMSRYTSFNSHVSGVEQKKGILRKNFSIGHGAINCHVEVAKASSAPFQRKLDYGHLKKLGPWNPNIQSTPLCYFGKDAQKKPKLYIIDGQHRFSLMQEYGLLVTNAVVYFDIDDSEAALLFKLANMHKKVDDWVSFNAAYLGNDPMYKEIIVLAEKHKLSTPVTNGMNKEEADLKHAGNLITIYKKDGLEGLDKFLSVFAKAKLPKTTDSGTYRGLASFLRKNKNVSVKDVVRTWKSLPLDDLKANGALRDAKQVEPHIQTAYNKVKLRIAA